MADLSLLEFRHIVMKYQAQTEQDAFQIGERNLQGILNKIDASESVEPFQIVQLKMLIAQARTHLDELECEIVEVLERG